MMLNELDICLTNVSFFFVRTDSWEMMVVIQGHSVLYILGSVTIHELGNLLRTSVAVKMSCGCFRHVYQWEWPSIVLRLIARVHGSLVCSEHGCFACS